MITFISTEEYYSRCLPVNSCTFVLKFSQDGAFSKNCGSILYKISEDAEEIEFRSRGGIFFLGL